MGRRSRRRGARQATPQAGPPEAPQAPQVAPAGRSWPKHPDPVAALAERWGEEAADAMDAALAHPVGSPERARLQRGAARLEALAMDAPRLVAQAERRAMERGYAWRPGSAQYDVAHGRQR